MTTMRTELAIVGGGMIGLALAAALGQAGIEVVLVERVAAGQRTAKAADLRTSAIAHGSMNVLNGVGIWPKVADAAAPILDIRIADGRAPVFLHYDHRELDRGPFGFNVENRLLRLAQLARLDELANVRQISAGFAGYEAGPGRVEIALDDGTTIAADLLIGADGRGSAVRRAAGIAIMSWRYPQQAIVTVIGHEAPHDGMAVEHFHAGGPFATLPMVDDDAGGHRSAIIWSEREDRAPDYLALAADEFDAELQARVGERLGAVRAIIGRAAHPLGVLHADSYVAERVALIGDAAHAIHPIAGQGLNMGIRDIGALAEVLAERARLGLDLGAAAGLARYQRWRRFDNLTLLAVTDTLNRLFSTAAPPVQAVRDLGIAAVGRLPPAKRFFMRHAMGLVGRLPRLVARRPL